MSHSNKLFFFLIFPLALFVGCGGGSTSGDPVKNGSTQNLSSIKVMLPEGVNIDLTETRVISGNEITDVQSSGDSKAIYREGSRGFALLESNDGTPLLMGFIGGDSKDISIRSTLIAALYYALGTVFQPEIIRAHYFEMDMEGLLSDDVLDEAKRLFLEDDNYLGSPGFAALIQQMVDKFKERSDTVDIVFKSRSPGSLEVQQNNVKSGVQIEEVDHESFRLTNQYRRRAHAFIYRTGYKQEGAAGEVVLVSDVTTQAPSPIKDVRVPSTKAVREFTGVIQDAAAGDGMKMAVTQSDVVELDLEDGNEYDSYKVRVVGPGLIDRKLPPLERRKVEELSWDTMIYDMFLPMLLDAVSEAKLAGGPDLKGLDEKYYEDFRNLVVLFASSIPSVEEALKSQDYSTAFTELIYSIENNAGSSLVMDIFEGFIKGAEAYSQELGGEIAIEGGERAAGLVGNVVKILKATDTLLKIGDYFRAIYAISYSSQLEEWDVKAKAVPVTLLPKEAVAYPYILKYLKAYVKDTRLGEGEVFEFRWSTTGDFGVLRDDMGHEGTEFSNSSLESPREVIYFSNKYDDKDLPEGAEDQVKVEVYIQGPGEETKIGEDIVTLKIEAYDYIIRPDGLTVDGDTRVRLRLQYPDGEQNITDNNYFDYQVIWKTTGFYGAFPGAVTNRTTYNNNTIEYIAVDEEVSRGIETISAAIYHREKDDSSSPYRLIQETEATIVIENDDRVDYDTQALSFYQACLDVDTGGEVFLMVVHVPKEEEAVRYTVSTIGDVWFGWSGVWLSGSAIPAITWTNTSWQAGEVADLGDSFRVHIIGATSFGPCGSSDIAARYATIRGSALIATYY